MNLDAWTQSFANALTKFWGEIAGFLPNLLGTIFVITLGLYVSKLITTWLGKIIEKLGFNKLCNKLGFTKLCQSFGLKIEPSRLVGLLVHIFFVLIILVAGAETLGLERLSLILDDFILYLPKLFGALLIAIIGLFVANTGKEKLEQSLDNAGVEYSSSAGKVLSVLVLFITFSLVVGQLELETELLNTIFSVLIASLGFALALSLGLGTKSIANSIVSGIYAREQLSPGEIVDFDGFVGEVVAVTTVTTILKNKNGECLNIPNQTLLNSQYVVLGQDYSELPTEHSDR